MSKSKADTWMPMFVADYAADTSRLSLEQHGAYLLLIFDYWRNGPPPDDDAVIARILGVERKEWFRLRPVISAFFRIEGGRWRHRRVDDELVAAQSRVSKAQERAAKGAAVRWGNASRNASSIQQASHQAPDKHMLEQCPPPSPTVGRASKKALPNRSDANAPRPEEARADVADWAVPSEIRRAFVGAMTGEEMLSYLRPASWEEESRTLTAATHTAHTVLAGALRDPRVLARAIELEPFNLAKPRQKEQAA